ncbi:hypothetical protein HFD88_000090 [Aspergillus terreus]|nr:hypothetical protein HFD88_000090 [Aspergillus terreus]
MKQKKSAKFGLTSDALRSYVELITKEVNEYIANANAFKQPRGTIDVGKVMAEITIYTASRSLQGKEVREKFDSTFAELYHDLDMGFAPINSYFRGLLSRITASERIRVLGADLPPLTYENLQKLELQTNVTKETLRLHAPIHSMLRAVKNPLQVEGTPYVIPTSHNVLSSPGFTARSPEYFSKPFDWKAHRWDGVNATGDDQQVDYGYGLQFAYVQLYAICVALARELKFKKLPNVEDVPATNYSSLFSRPWANSVVQYERRDAAAKD